MSGTDAADFAPRRPRMPTLFGPMRRIRAGVLIGGGITLVILLTLALAPWIAPYDPARQDILHRFASPSALHWLGTDHLGRDELSRVLYGGRFSVTVAFISLGLSLLIGIGLGVISARAGGWVDEVIMRAVDLFISFPDVIVALFLVAIFGPGYVTLILALTAVSWTPFARMMRGLASDINRRDYVKAAELLNCSRWYIGQRHIIPNSIRPITAVALLRFGHKLIVVGGLSFLGLGVQPPLSDWGSMLAESRRYMDRAPMLVMAPGIAIFVTALAVTTLGQALDSAGARRPRARFKWLRRRRLSQ